MKISVQQLESGWWHIRGEGPCNWAQPPCWPATEEQIMAHAFAEAGEEFLRAVMAASIAAIERGELIVKEAE